MKLAVGMPVFERAWCLHLWFDCLEAQNLAPKEDISLCFAYSPGFDGTYDILRRRGDDYGDLLIYEYDLKSYADRLDVARFHELASLRNGLLDMVKETQADYFLSWDNDILFEPNQLEHLLDCANSSRVVGALMDMGGRDDQMVFPSMMHFGRGPGEQAYRTPWEAYTEPTKVDVVMGVKLMGKDVYENVRYRWDPVGEDIGFCFDCEAKHYERWLQPKARGLHMYDKVAAIQKMRRHGTQYPAVLEHLYKWHTND